MALLRSNLAATQNRIKQVYDKKHIERELAVGDWVYLKLQNYRQNSIEQRKHQKLSPRYYGPYRVLEKIGAVAYRLELPPGSWGHPVFHVSLLKRKIGEQEVAAEQPPQWETISAQAPAEILATRGMADGEELLVRWKGSTKAEAS